VAGMH